MHHTITPDFTLKVDDTLSLRLLTLDDTDELYALVDRNRAHLRPFLYWVDGTQNQEDTKKYIEENLPLWLSFKELHLCICKNTTIIGSVGLHSIDFFNKQAVIGYWLDKDHQGQGIMAKSVHALIEYLFTVKEFHRLELRCAVHNYKSQNVAKRLGFTQEGVLHDAFYQRGTYFDAYLYALLNKASKKEFSS